MKNFSGARSFCKNEFHPLSDVVTVNNILVNNFINSLRESATPSSSLWIGLTSQDFVNWNWVLDGSALDFENWDDFEPSYDGLCVEMWAAGDGTWNDLGCSTSSRRFVCQYELYGCFGLNSTSPDACGNGLCTSEDSCLCSTDECLYLGFDCSDFHCDGVLMNMTDRVCNMGRGSCVDCDLCICNEDSNYVGKFCHEKIGSIAYYNVNEGHIRVEYESRLEGVPTRFLDSTGFVPSDIINNTEALNITNFERAHLEFRDNLTHLVVEVDDDIFRPDGSTVVEIKSVTRPSDVVLALIVIIQNSDSDVDPSTSADTEDGVGGSDTNSEVKSGVQIIVGLVSGIAAVTLVCVICLVGIVLFILTMIARKFDPGKFNSLESVNELESKNMLARLVINQSLFKINYDELIILKSLGSGSGGTVFKANWGDSVIAFKCFDTRKIFDDQNSFDDFEKEASLMASIAHPNIVQFYGCTLKPPRVGILLEFCPNGDIRNYLEDTPLDAEDEVRLEERLNIIHGIVCAMKFLHSKNIVHRDLKPDNVLLDEMGTPKVTDFGLSKILNVKTEESMTQGIGTSHYIAPEVFTDNQYTEKCDVFSFGIMMFEIITGNFKPFGMTQGRIELKIANNPEFRPNVGEVGYLDDHLENRDEIITMMENCWNHSYFFRPSFSDILEILKNNLKL